MCQTQNCRYFNVENGVPPKTEAAVCDSCQRDAQALLSNLNRLEKEARDASANSRPRP